MKAVIQRVSKAKVDINGATVGEIGCGLLILLGVGHEDNVQTAEKLWQKIAKLRIFDDEDGKTNLSLADVRGDVLVVSQFTLYADCSRGNRPSFTDAAKPEIANSLYEQFVGYARDGVCSWNGVVQTGEFGADMNVSLVNQGPFTILLEL